MQRSVDGLRVTPWADWSEWWDLQELLAHGMVLEANERVQCYLIRRRQAVPVAMITTVNLRYQLEYPSADEYSQRLGLAMALVRFVNGMTDRIQPRGGGAFAKSVHSLAMELKLPPILVEIRHQASHNSLPRLTALESGARKALEWLEEFYWNAQYQRIRHHLDNSPRGLKRIFSRRSESQDPLGNEVFRETECEAEEGFDRSSEDGSTSVLQKLKTLSNGLAENMRKRKDATNVEAERPQNSAEQWSECNNREEWKMTPIGFIPGQKRAAQWPTKFIEASKEDPNHGVDPQQTSSLGPAEVNNTASPNIIAELPQKCITQLNPTEARKVREMTLHYKKLLGARSTV